MRDNPEKSIVSAEEKVFRKVVLIKNILARVTHTHTNRDALTFFLQVILARLCGGHHVSCHFIHVARSLLEDWQLLAVAVRLHLSAEGKCLRHSLEVMSESYIM